MDDLSETPHPVRLAIKAGNKVVFVESSEIRAIEARGNYVVLLLGSSSLSVREAISTVAERLKAYGFFRIHRSHIVNAAFVTEIKPLNTGEYLLRMKDNTTYTVSRTYKKSLRYLGHVPIGNPNIGYEAASRKK